VQKYAQLHGGRAYAARNLKGGMCFTVAFPAYLEDMAEKRPFAGGD
jgi:signal transduction histidine kinase